MTPQFNDTPPFEGAEPMAFAEGDLPDGNVYVATANVARAELATELLHNVRRMVEAAGAEFSGWGFYWADPITLDDLDD